MAGPAPLTEDEGAVLIGLARAALAARLAGLPAPGPARLTPRLDEPQGAFVTVLLEGRLRGCIGIVRPDEALWRVILHCALAAGFEDPRFPPLEPMEAPRLSLEISVLSAPRVVRDASEIRIGRDGLIVTQGRRQGLLLPQVALEHGWDAPGFLRETCRKAGLEDDAWTRGARMEAFEAQVFAEGRRRPVPARP